MRTPGVLPSIVVAVTTLSVTTIAEPLCPKGCVPPEGPLSSASHTSFQSGVGTVISDLTDPTGGIFAPPGYIDIAAASISQDGGFLTFAVETDASILTTLTVDGDHLMFLWLLDTDQNSATGQPHGGVGSEFNVRCLIEPGAINGYVDVTGAVPGGGTGAVSVVGNRIEIMIGLGQIGNPAQFNWRSEACGRVNGAGVGCNGETSIASATTLPFTPPASVELVAPLMMLSPTGPTSGQLEVVLRDEAGALLDPLDYTLQFSSSNTTVATVDANGLVTVHTTPVVFSDTPYVSAAADGVPSGNSSVIRSTTSDLGITHQYYDGEYVSYYLPATLEGVDLDAITTSFEVVPATDLAYLAQQTALDTAPFGGERQYLVLDVTDDGATAPCGLSGNPIRLGWTVGLPYRPNCYICESCWGPFPDFGTQPRHPIFYHEIGHNFTFASPSMAQYMTSYGPMQGTYVEGLASLAGMWSWFMIESCSPDLLQSTRDSIREGYEANRYFWDQNLGNYLAAGANYDSMGADVLDAILFAMFDEFGPKAWYDFFSTFTPPDQSLPIALDTREKQATWLVAAFSASTGQDLRSRFADDYGFPIDNAAWPSILAAVQQRIDARNYADLDEDLDGVLNACDIAPNALQTCPNDFAAAADGTGGERLSRFGCVSAPEPPATAGGGTAIRVRFRTLLNTDPGDPDGASVCVSRSLLPSPPPSISQFVNRTRWLGPPVEIVDEATPTPPNYIGAPLVCTAEEAAVRDWSSAGLAATFSVEADTSRIYFFDWGVVPCSVYEVSRCSDPLDEATCSEPLLVLTSRMADAWPPFDGAGQPSFTDINCLVNKFKGIPFMPGATPLGGAPEWHALVAGNVVADYDETVVNKKVSFLHIGVAVDGFKGIPYREEGPCDSGTGIDNCGVSCNTEP